MFFETSRQILLPHGLVDSEGGRHRTAVLRPLSGRDEAMLAAARPGERGLLSRLLAACLERIGDYESPALEHVAALTRGDRQRLALFIRSELFGDRLSLVIGCPNPACGQRADMDLEISSLIPPREEAAPDHIVVQTPDGPARLREPTGADDDQLPAPRPPDDQEGRGRRAAWLWSRLVLDLGGRGTIAPEVWLALPVTTRHAIALGLAEETSAPDLAFYSRCPSCAATLELELEPLQLLRQELRFGAERMSAEIHCLAWHYGWSEGDILALPRTRRWSYIELIRRQVEGRPLLERWS